MSFELKKMNQELFLEFETKNPLPHFEKKKQNIEDIIRQNMGTYFRNIFY